MNLFFMPINMNQNKIAELQQWLRDNPEHVNRVIIESDLRKLNPTPALPEGEGGATNSVRTFERDTFDLREHNFHNQ